LENKLKISNRRMLFWFLKTTFSFSGRGFWNTLSFPCCQVGRRYENKLQWGSWSAGRLAISRMGRPSSSAPFTSQPPFSPYLCKLPYSTRPKTEKELFWFRTHISTRTICAIKLPQWSGRRWHIRLCWEISHTNETTSSKNVDDASRVTKLKILNICCWDPTQLIIQNLCTNLFSVKITQCA